MSAARVFALSMIGAAAAASLTGCTSFSGLAGSKSELACKAPDGVICTSVSGIYANSIEGNLPGQKPQLDSSKKADSPVQGVVNGKDEPAMPSYSPRDLTTPNSGDPIRLAPVVLRVWIAPWEDTDGDLHDQHYVYTVINQGKWLIEANQQTIRDAFKPVYPLGKDSDRDQKATESADTERVFPLNSDSGVAKQ